MKLPPAVKLTADQRNTLQAWVHAPSTPQKIVLRSMICLLAGEGKPNQAIARELNTSRPTVILWRKRFAAKGCVGIAEDAPHGRSSRRTKDELVGLYLNPPDRALVLCVDEKSQVRALDRTQPGLPMKKGRCGTLPHVYERHGATSPSFMTMCGILQERAGIFAHCNFIGCSPHSFFRVPKLPFLVCGVMELTTAI